MNYSLDHDILKDEIFTELKGSEKTTAWIVLCAIKHFTKHNGYMDLYTSQYSNDLGVSKNTLRNALQFLISKNYIKITKEYQRKGNIPNRYVSTKVDLQRPINIKGGSVQHQGGSVQHQGGSPGYTVNNSKRIINGDDSPLVGDHSPKLTKKEIEEQIFDINTI